MPDPPAPLGRRTITWFVLSLGLLAVGALVVLGIDGKLHRPAETPARVVETQLRGPMAFPVRTALVTLLTDPKPNHFGMHARFRVLDAEVDCGHVHQVVFGERAAPDLKHELFIGFMGKPGAPLPGTYDVRAEVGGCDVDGGPCNPGKVVVIAGMTHVLGEGGMDFWSAVSGSVTVRDAGADHVEAAVDLQLALDGGAPQPLTGVLELRLCGSDAG